MTVLLLTRILLVVYFIEVGLLLVFVPWSAFWERNYFAQAWPWMGALMFNAYIRGAVTGVGIVTTAAGLRDLMSGLFARRQPPVEPTDGSKP